MNRKSVIIFLTVCFGLSYAAAALFHFLGGVYASILGSLFSSAYMFIPLVSVVITQLITGEQPLLGCGIKFKLNWWWLAGILSMAVFAFLTLPVSALFPGVSISSENETMTTVLANIRAQGLEIGCGGYILITFVSGIFAAATINALFAFGEEAAWRGFLSRCLDRLGFWKKSLLVGTIWGLWHMPIILMGHNYPSHPVAGVFMMIAFCVLFAPLMQLVRDKSGSAVASSMMHGSLNAFAGISLVLLTGYDDLICGCCGVAGFAILLLADLALAFWMKKRFV